MSANFTLMLRPLGLILIFCLSLTADVRSQAPTLTYQPVITTGLSFPIDVVNAGDGTNRIFIAQQGGIIKVYSSTYTFLGDFVTVTGMNISSEEGLLSVAFHPDYETNRFFYVYFTNNSGNLQIDRYQTRADNPNLADVATRVNVLTINHPTNSNHNGAKLIFGSDNHLYFATGDGGSGGDPLGNAQNGNSLLGKMIRITVNTSLVAPFYSIPADNPFVANPNVRDEVWALGLRNPFRWSFDRVTGAMWIGDVGQGAWEEISFRPGPIAATGGANYGWDCFEGNHTFDGCAIVHGTYVPAVSEYANGPGSAAVTGGYVYRGTEFPTLTGTYIAADYYSGNNYLVRPNGSGGYTTTIQTGLPTNISAFGENENGTTMYALSLGGGQLYRITATGGAALPVRLTSFSLNQGSNYNELVWKTSREVNFKEFRVEFSFDGLNFNQAGQVVTGQRTAGSTYQLIHQVNNDRRIFYRLKMVDADDQFTYSRIITTSLTKPSTEIEIQSTLTRGGTLQVELNVPFETMKVYNMHGQLMLTEDPGGRTGLFNVNTSQLSKGMYILAARNQFETVSRRFMVQ